MIVVTVVVGFAVALCVAGWIPLVRDALRADHVLPGPADLTGTLDGAAGDGDVSPLPQPVAA